MKKDVKFEAALKRLETIVDQLESGEIDLDKSIKIYEEGNDLVKVCLEKLNSAEKKIKQISKDQSGNIIVDDFE
ncbi:MAG: exodeoxyribonuclease VII small subunit [Calditrichaeota bacterium]|nr:MAG: exodeoxyribonuclease VII small subunit [Calditrichota bacterium]MBL1204221.1 exodeoxyribonuclease VII small subunit [Calditrichota bacterium]NOG44051.1 exodeoxyribonuclease VII small subunit [Calditrichota bacterium]